MASQVVTSFDVYKSPEFRTFCERFGIAWELGTVDLTIELPCKGLMTVTQKYYATDGSERPGDEYKKKSNDMPEPEFVETTTNHNEQYATHQVVKDK